MCRVPRVMGRAETLRRRSQATLLRIRQPSAACPAPHLELLPVVFHQVGQQPLQVLLQQGRRHGHGSSELGEAASAGRLSLRQRSGPAGKPLPFGAICSRQCACNLLLAALSPAASPPCG